MLAGGGSAVAPLLSAGRVVLGPAVGGAARSVPMYVAELAPPGIRGRLVLTFQLGIGVGLVIPTLVGASAAGSDVVRDRGGVGVPAPGRPRR